MTTLSSGNIVINNRRTSVRLEPEMWDCLSDVAERERLTLNELCSRINAKRHQSSLTSAIRVFILGYYRQLAGPVKGARAKQTAGTDA
jgi:predicted DNA-binding ribbon-helix-helix protein